MKKPENSVMPYMEEVEEEIKTFIENSINTFIKWDVIKFFGNNPATYDTAENIARNIGREEKLVKIEIETLARCGLLEETKGKDRLIYTFSSNSDKREIVNKFLNYGQTREGRAKILYHILKRLEI